MIWLVFFLNPLPVHFHIDIKVWTHRLKNMYKLVIKKNAIIKLDLIYRNIWFSSPYLNPTMCSYLNKEQKSRWREENYFFISTSITAYSYNKFDCCNKFKFWSVSFTETPRF